MQSLPAFRFSQNSSRSSAIGYRPLMPMIATASGSFGSRLPDGISACSKRGRLRFAIVLLTSGRTI